MGLWNDIELTGLVLHTGRLTLRPWQPSDAVTVQRILADERMHTWLPLPHPYTAEIADTWVNSLGLARAAAGTGFDLAVCENTTARVVGAVALHSDLGSEMAEIGYWTAATEWGQGFAAEAASTVTRFALGNGARRLVIRCDIANLASARVALACGYHYEGVARDFVVRDRTMTGPIFARVPGDPGERIAPAWPALDALTDGEIIVRPMTPDDWPVILAEHNNDESLAWSFTGEPMSEAAARDEAARAGLDWLVSHKARFVICDAATGEGAGTLYVLRSGPVDVGLIGYGVLPAFRGRGFTTRALRLVSEWIFGTTSIGRLELGHKVENLASGRAALKAGFQREATLAGRLRNHDGSFSDEHYYGLVKPR